MGAGAKKGNQKRSAGAISISVEPEEAGSGVVEEALAGTAGGGDAGTGEELVGPEHVLTTEAGKDCTADGEPVGAAAEIGDQIPGRVACKGEVEGVIPSTTDEGVIASATGERVVAGASGKPIVGAVASERVVEVIAGGIDGSAGDEAKVFQEGERGKREGVGALHRVKAIAITDHIAG